jgi:uncharacterized protein (TIGR02266 family)
VTQDDGEGSERRVDPRFAVTLRVDYDDADDLITDYTQNLSTGGACIASSRELPVGTEIRLALSFPGLVEPIRVAAIVRWARGGTEAMLGVEFADAEVREELATFIARIRNGDPALVQRALKVLVVEDNPHVAELLRVAFGNPKNLGPELTIDCRFVGDGRAALEAVQQTRFDAMIVDVYLPVLDGPKLITAIRQDMRSKLPIIAVSAGGDQAHRAAMAAGADIFIDKPMRLRRVIETMRSIMKLDAPK